MNYIWPEADEDKLVELGRAWIAYGGNISERFMATAFQLLQHPMRGDLEHHLRFPWQSITS